MTSQDLSSTHRNEPENSSHLDQRGRGYTSSDDNGMDPGSKLLRNLRLESINYEHNMNINCEKQPETQRSKGEWPQSKNVNIELISRQQKKLHQGFTKEQTIAHIGSDTGCGVFIRAEHESNHRKGKCNNMRDQKREWRADNAPGGGLLPACIKPAPDI